MITNTESAVESINLNDKVDTKSNATSESLMPDMRDTRILDSFNKSSDEANLHMVTFFDSTDKQGDKNQEKVDPLGQTKEQREARERIVKATTDIVTKFNFDGPGKAITAAAIEHQFNHGGGAKAADALAKDISEKLPNGMKLEIRKDAAFDKMVRDSLRPGQAMPDYVRVVELKDKAGKVIGSFGVTASEAKPQPQPQAKKPVIA